MPVVPTSDADQLPLSVRVGLGAVDVGEDAGRLAQDVLDVQARDLAGSHRGGVPEEEDSPVADVLGVVGVDRSDDVAQFGNGERVGLADRRDAEEPAQPSANSSYEEVCSGIGEPLLTVAMGNAGAVAVERAEVDALLGALSEERRDASGGAGNGLISLPDTSAPTAASHRRKSRASRPRVRLQTAVAMRSVSTAVSATRAGVSGASSEVMGGVAMRHSRRNSPRREGTAAGSHLTSRKEGRWRAVKSPVVDHQKLGHSGDHWCEAEADMDRVMRTRNPRAMLI